MKKSNRTGSRLLMALVFLFLYAPIFLLIIFSFNAGDSSAVWKGFSLSWYGSLFKNRIIMESVYTTLLISILATIVATVAGTFAAIGLYSLSRRWRDPLLTVNNIPMMNADIVTGVGLCLFFAAFFRFWGSFAAWFNDIQNFIILPTRLHLGFTTLLLAHIAFNIPYVILNVAPKLRQMDKNLVDAAKDLGCTWFMAFRKVILPEIKPGIVSGALIAFTMSIDDFVISYFTAGSSTSTLAMTIYGMTKKRITPEINAISTLLFVVVLVLLVVVNVREAQQEKKASRPIAEIAAEEVRKADRAEFFKARPWIKRTVTLVLVCALGLSIIILGRATRGQPVVNVCSWGEYIDPELINMFEEETGIRVN
ncbi:MAG: ABC transporter permease subunit, partial [Oscillospiraceae bacterium]|nr:ABC transporter permease subunit [Oscillospiraceae bacterium]